MSIKQRFSQKLNDLQIDTTSAKIVVAVSAGPDSMALLDLLYHSLANPQSQLIVAHVNHQLRPGSDEELQVVQHYATDKGLVVENYDWPVAEHPKTGVEASARIMRYQFMHRLQKKWQASYVMTAHHGDDVAETILLKLIRSGDAQEMASLSEKREFYEGELIRPLLNFSKQQLLTYLVNQQIDYVTDETNATDFTMRNRIRHHVIPKMSDETNHLIENSQRYQQSVTKLTQAQTQLFQLVTTLTQVTAKLYRGKIKDFTKIPKTNWSDYVSYLTMQAFSDKVFLSEQQVKQLKHILTETGRLTLTRDVELLVKENQFFLAHKQPQIESQMIQLNQPVHILGQVYLLSETKKVTGFKFVATFDVPLNEPLYLGLTPNQPVLLSDSRHQKVKKVFAKAGVPTVLKGYYLSIYGSDIYWIQNIYHYNSLAQQSRKLNLFVAK
ncbi:tRNA lysidine(34) synthetase TilS [Holzapfeliella sp. He02]|uniref:tRNA(Ile)-lysidine synthase n=1 Tax=Holzapfeliella saturejae TaxID=3082953 RepID=A0ABU8SFH0_9LACO